MTKRISRLAQEACQAIDEVAFDLARAAGAVMTAQMLLDQNTIDMPMSLAKDFESAIHNIRKAIMKCDFDNDGAKKRADAVVDRAFELEEHIDMASANLKMIGILPTGEGFANERQAEVSIACALRHLEAIDD